MKNIFGTISKILSYVNPRTISALVAAVAAVQALIAIFSEDDQDEPNRFPTQDKTARNDY